MPQVSTLHEKIGKDLYHSCTTEPIRSRKHVQRRTYTSNSHCNEIKLCLYWLLCRFWYQRFNLRDIRILRGGQPVVHHDTTDTCLLYVTTMKAMNFQDDILSFAVDN